MHRILPLLIIADIFLSTYGALPPAYLMIPNVNKCSGTKLPEPGASFSVRCWPKKRPQGCPLASWKKVIAYTKANAKDIFNCPVYKNPEKQKWKFAG